MFHNYNIFSVKFLSPCFANNVYGNAVRSHVILLFASDQVCTDGWNMNEETCSMYALFRLVSYTLSFHILSISTLHDVISWNSVVVYAS